MRILIELTIFSHFSLGTKRWAFGKQEWIIRAYPNSVSLWEMVYEGLTVHLRKYQQFGSNLPANIHFINDSFAKCCDGVGCLFITFIFAAYILFAKCVYQIPKFTKKL